MKNEILKHLLERRNALQDYYGVQFSDGAIAAIAEAAVQKLRPDLGPDRQKVRAEDWLDRLGAHYNLFPQFGTVELTRLLNDWESIQLEIGSLRLDLVRAMDNVVKRPAAMRRELATELRNNLRAAQDREGEIQSAMLDEYERSEIISKGLESARREVRSIRDYSSSSLVTVPPFIIGTCEVRDMLEEFIASTPPSLLKR